MSPATEAEGHEPTPEEVGLLATEALGPEAEALADLDTAGFARALGTVVAALARRPLPVLECTTRYGAALAAGGWSTLARSFGFPVAGPMRPDARDHRFQDLSWQHHPLFYGMQQWYLAWGRWLHELIDAAGVDPAVAEKAHVATEFLVDALSPTNFLWSNPAALRRAVDSRGLSVLAGLRNFFHDLAHNGGKPSQVDASAFRLGENLAATPGQVVFRNDLMELIQYSAQTETTYEVPLLLSPPWINKYYIMDLAPGRSFVEWAVQHGHTVFAISYHNPDAADRDVRLDDYLIKGPVAAMDVIREITGATYGISITGNAGPTSDKGAKPVGMTYIGVAGPDGTEVEELT